MKPELRNCYRLCPSGTAEELQNPFVMCFCANFWTMNEQENCCIYIFSNLHKLAIHFSKYVWQLSIIVRKTSTLHRLCIEFVVVV
ncbi:hypothetical protein Sjap_012150 [Stephania japonica]|uniref:Uncharacterized protein n=1 Tax=Stephania japonica TaxID=461633 RepID=A0AAP0IVI5_9MAGN